MKSRTPLVILLVLMISSTAAAYAGRMPGGTLPDPRGVNHTIRAPLVILITAPTYRDDDPQKDWERMLIAEMPRGGNFYMLEDMSVSDFKEVARKDMKKDWAGPPPILLIDKTGAIRRSFGVGPDETVVLVYNKSGNLVYSSSGPASVSTAKKAWQNYKK